MSSLAASVAAAFVSLIIGTSHIENSPGEREPRDRGTKAPRHHAEACGTISPVKKRELLKLGYEGKKLLADAMAATEAAADAGVTKSVLRRRMKALLDHPQGFFDDPHLGDLARGRAEATAGIATKPEFEERRRPAPYRQWGGADVDRSAVEQLENACRLPVSARGG